MERDAEAFATLLRRYRVAAELSQEALAERAGLSLDAVSALERGLRQTPRRETVQLLAQALDLRPAEQAALEALVSRRRGPAPAASGPCAIGSASLPQYLTPLLGREREVAAVRDRLLAPATRLLTLTGPGGVGKTRLAVQVAATVLDVFPHGVYFVNLAPISDPTLVLPAIAQTLGVKEAGGQPLVQTLQARLRDTQTLLLLDNFEQVVEAAPQVKDLLVAGTGVMVLATSRAILHLQGEREYAVPPLSLPDVQRLPSLEALAQSEAARLFIARAQDIKPDFALTTETAPAVAAICVRLDGLPLAIELAAARLRLFGPETLLARLDRRLPLLTGGARDLPARQRTLRATIAWSHDLLAPAEQALFRRLAVFVGGCTLEAVEAVCAPDAGIPAGRGGDVLESMEALVEQSLLRREESSGEGVASDPRFVMLETIREFALERLAEAQEVPALQRRHATYYVALVQEAQSDGSAAEQGAMLARLEAERDNLIAVLEWARQSGATDVGMSLKDALPMPIQMLIPSKYHTAREVGVREGFAVWAASYDQEPNPVIAVEDPRTDALTATLPVASVLDVGTGTGRHALRWARRGVPVTALDPSPEMLALARQAAAREGLPIRFLEACFEEGLPVAAGQFDLVICALTLCFVPNLAGAIGECARAVRPGGFLLISDAHPDMVAAGSRCVVYRPGCNYLLPYMHHTRAQYLDSLALAGCAICTVLDVPIGDVPDRYIPRMLKWPQADAPFCLIVLAQKTM